MLDPKDVRFKLDPDLHAAMAVLADADCKDLGEFVRDLVEREVRRRVLTARVITERTSRLGISGNAGD